LTTNGRLRQEGNSVRSAIKCAFASTAAKRRAENDRLLPHLRSETESASWKKTSNASRDMLSANDSELLIAEVRVAGQVQTFGGHASIWSRRGSD
jgi:hypothetical protein